MYIRTKKHHILFGAVCLLAVLAAFLFSEPEQVTAAQTYAVLTSGTTWTVPTGVTSVKVWAIGAGGGGAGSPASDATAGGGGGAGGVSYKTYTVTAGQNITYALGAAGSGGSGAASGIAGGNTTATYGGVTITANGGGGGIYNTGANASGGTGSGGDDASTGGAGKGESGDTGGGYGGAIGGGTGTDNGTSGGTGAQSVDVSGLQAAVVAAGQSWTSGGASGPCCDDPWFSTNHGAAATGFGSGGGGAGYYGGNGGAGRYGGGGGGAAGYNLSRTGGAGGQGVIVLSYDVASTPGTPGTPMFSNVTSSSMRVSWTAASGATSYKVERCTGASCSNYVEIASGIATTYYDDTNLSAGTTYRYRVRGTNSAGDGSYSNTASQTTSACSAGGNGGNVTGYAWSDTIGWISFNSENDPCTTQTYGFDIDADGVITGYAWSEHIGWISANSSDLSGCPQSPCSAYMEADAMRGWLKALSAASGWDGWISLSGTSPAYGPTLMDGVFSGYAWGSDVVGWISFSGTGSGYSYDVTTDFEPCDATYQCVDATHYDNVCTPLINENTSCGAGLICAAGVVPCVVPGNATGDLWLSPALVPTGNTTEVNWNVTDTTSCRVFGDNGDEWYGAETGLQISSAITETTLYTLECANSLGEATTTIDVAYAVVVPTWVER